MSTWILKRFQKFDSQPALAGPWGVTTYAQLLALTRKAQADLQALNLSEPTVIAILGEHGPAVVAWLLALESAGHFAVPLAGNAQEFPAKLSQVSAQWLVTAEGDAWKMYPRIDSSSRHEIFQKLARQKEAGLVLFSSGTSGSPKAMVQNFTQLLKTYENRRANRLPILALLGCDHIGGINTLLSSLAAGALLVVPENRSVDSVIKAIRNHSVVVLPATPTFLNLLLLSGVVHLPSLRLITYGTEPMPESLLHRLRKAFPVVRFVQTFGTSETGILHTSSPDPDSPFLKIDDDNVVWKVVEGELWLKSKTQVEGYINATNEKFTSDGWFRTGDKVESGPDGTIRILGRIGELINVGGEKVMPTEIESIILGVSGVIDCRVYGEKNVIVGQAVVAEVVAQPDVDLDALKSSIRSACRAVLSAYKVPTRINFVSDISCERLKKRRG